ncbi:MAG: cellulose biosynthesis cyclic di-GMP-binding regulatory protein BcsB [Cellulosilyticaceae bacterium]
MKEKIKILIVMFVFLVTSPHAVQGATKVNTVAEETFVHEESYKADHAVKGLFSQVNESFHVGEWDVTKSILTLSYSVTQLTDKHLSDMTVSINGIPFYTQRLKFNNSGKQQLKLNIPSSYLKEGINTVTIETYIRTKEGLPCVDDVSASSWMNIFKDSSVAVAYTPRAKISGISAFYKEITSINALEYQQSLVATHENPSNVELEMALTALSGISKNAVIGYEKMGFEAVETLANLGEKQYTMYLSRLSTLPTTFENLLTNDQKKQAHEGAIMALVQAKPNQWILLIVGEEEEALRRASRLLGNVEGMSQLETNYKVIKPQEDVDTRTSGIDPYITLTPTGTYVKGSFRQNGEFYIDYPKNRMIAEGSQVYLKIRYSENLDFERSLVTVYINDCPVGSKKLSKEKANGDEVLLDIPMDIKVSGNFVVKVGFDLEIKDAWCSLREGEMPWGFVSNESMLKLNSIENPFLIFENYPAPFVIDGKLNQLAVVVPDKISQADYAVLGPLALTLGRNIKDNTGVLKVTKASEVDDLSQNNTIVVGTFKDNQMIRKLNKELFFKFSEDGEQILSNEKQILDPEYSKKLGTVQLLNAPSVNNHRALLVISGVTEKGMVEAASYLGTVEGLWKIYGDGYIADHEKVTPYRFKKDNEQTLSFEEKVLMREDLVPLMVGVLAAAGMIITIGVFLILKYRRGMKNEKK